MPSRLSASVPANYWQYRGKRKARKGCECARRARGTVFCLISRGNLASLESGVVGETIPVGLPFPRRVRAANGNPEHAGKLGECNPCVFWDHDEVAPKTFWGRGDVAPSPDPRSPWETGRKPKSREWAERSPLTAGVLWGQLSDFCPRRPYKRVQNGAKQTVEFPLFCCISLSVFVPRLG
jgi:hypothetical protein